MLIATRIVVPNMATKQLIRDAQAVLANNDMGGWTRPTGIGLYPHQWLWDSFFIAIGLRHIDLERAKEEVRSPFRAQWRNGMLPHIIFGDAKGYHAGPEMWKSSKKSPNAPRNIETTGVTQPPMAAEAVVRIGELMNARKRQEWYAEMYPQIVHFHQWLYRERCPRDDGLVLLVLSWESGMDNSPPWMEVMHHYATSHRAQFMETAGFTKFVERFRKDTKVVPAKERISTVDLQAVYYLIKKLRKNNYDSQKILAKHPLQIVDVVFNCILMRANEHLATMAKFLGEDLPADIQRAMRLSPLSLELLWDDKTNQYYNRDVVSGKLIRVPSLSTFLPLYASALPKARVQNLLSQLRNPQTFGTPFPVPSTPVNSPHFKPHCYWQGPSWVNTNWLIIDGLKRNGQTEEAEKLRQKTIDMVKKGGIYEYFHPFNATPAGAAQFSWTAALVIDLLHS